MPRILRRPRRAVTAVLLGAAASCASPGTPADPEPPAARPAARASARPQGHRVADFALDAVYTDDRGGVLGERWVHRAHGMPVTVLRIQSVPQVFLAFHTPPVSDRGEPHTGEHLLLGKGTRGKTLAVEESMSLIESTAWTSQTDVCYSWNCAAGKRTFFRSVEQYLEALLLPDYTDEEIRREVCHVGPVRDEAAGTLSLDEKGTIYQEMVSSYEKRWIVWERLAKRLWGEDHPLALSSGGEPSAVRTCTPEHVREFHAAHYHLGPGTHMIVSLPDSIPGDEFLATLSSQMAAVEARPELRGRPKPSHPIPPARTVPRGAPLVVPFPNANEDDGGLALIAWRPVPLGTQADRVRGELFLATLGSGDSATLYKRLMDRETREVAVDAAEMSASLDASKVDLLPGVWFDGFPPRNATPERLAEIVAVIRAEIARVAALPEGAPDLVEFDRKALVRLAEREKSLRRQIDSPPLFGHRGAGGFWLDHLRLLDQGGGFERSVALAPVFAELRAELERGSNPWKKVVADLGLAEEPYVGVSVPSRAELERRSTEKAKRIEGYVADVVRAAGPDATGDEQAALARFAADYDAKTAALAAAEKDLPKPRLVDDVPLTPDPSIRLEEVAAGGVRGHRAVFDSMTFAESSLAFRVSADDETLPWLAVLPRLVTESGVVEDGKPVPYDVASERRAREIHALTAEWALRPSRGRHELRITASGADAAEAVRALDWIDLCLRHAWIAPENLPRLRDLVAEEIRSTRTRLGGSEESWVREAAAAVRWQRDRTYLATSSLHARLFLLARCEWRLMDAPAGGDARDVDLRLGEIEAFARKDPDAETAARGLAGLASAWRTHGTPSDAKWSVPIAERLREMVADMAPSTVAADLRTLVATCRADLAVPPAAALRQVEALLDATVRGGGSARFVVTGSRASTDALVARLGPMLSSLGEGSAARTAPAIAVGDSGYEPGVVDTRAAQHAKPVEPGARPHVAVLGHGLVHGAGTTGVFVLSGPGFGLDDVEPEWLVKDLAARVFGGSGAHAFFMKTWGAGLAYSNGLSLNPYEGRIQYYAERCPDLVQTMTFVSGLVEGAEALDDPWLAEYCVAGAVAWSRESDEFERRARVAADELADGDTPERVARWRKAVLDLRTRPGLWDEMKPHVWASVGRVIPGPVHTGWRHALLFTIAPEPMLARWEEFLEGMNLSQVSVDVRVPRLYGRDFWVVE